MRTLKMYQSVEVIYRKLDDCPLRDLQYTFFQLVYIYSGHGQLKINGNRLPYQQGNLMLLTPSDTHNFEIAATTEFLLIRFNPSHIRNFQWKSIDELECLLYYAAHLSGCILRCKEDEVLVRGIADSLLDGIRRKDIYDEDLTIHLVNALIVLAARNIAKLRPPRVREHSDNRVLEIINYIELNITSPSLLKAAVIAGKFGLSESYLGSFFKRQCGETIQHFIAAYRYRLILHRLQFSDRRIHEIADEFGFADESHLNKFFKKHRGISLTAYRKANGEGKPLHDGVAAETLINNVREQATKLPGAAAAGGIAF